MTAVDLELNLKNIIAELREVAQAVNEFADNMERIEKKYTDPIKEGQYTDKFKSKEEQKSVEDKKLDGTCSYCEYYNLSVNEHPCCCCYDDYDRPCFTPKEEEQNG